MKATLRRLAGSLKHRLRRPATVAAEPGAEAADTATRFADVQRRLRIYLRALWQIDFVLQQATATPEDDEAVSDRPFIDFGTIRLPASLTDAMANDGTLITGLEIYRAAATHAAAHRVYSTQRFAPRAFSPLEIALISLIEDARVEALAIRRFPGLQPLWARQHTATASQQQTAGDYFGRLARALLDEHYCDDDAWVVLGRMQFAAAAEAWEDDRLAQKIGLALAEAWRTKKISFNPQADGLSVGYRDDNRYLWRRAGPPLEIVTSHGTGRVISGGRKKPSRQQKQSVAADAKAGQTSAPAGLYFYPEWNYRTQQADQGWVTVREELAAAGKLHVVEQILSANKPLLSRMKKILLGMRDGSVRRLRKLEEGDEIDLNQVIRAQIDLRQGLSHDPRVMMRSVRKLRDISVLILLDLSGSMNDKLAGRDQTALQLTQQVSAMLADAINTVGDAFALHGFTSKTRHNVTYFRLKDFDQPYDEAAKARLAGIQGMIGTRMGAAIRHATHCLDQQKSAKKLLILISDGEPTDIDVPDNQYLRDDARQSVAEARQRDVHTYCISLDPRADQYVSRIFGRRNYIVVDHIRRLPEKMLLLYAALTRSH